MAFHVNCLLGDMSAQQRFKLACASAQSDLSLGCSHEETLHPWLFFVPSEDSDQPAHMRRMI